MIGKIIVKNTGQTFGIKKFTPAPKTNKQLKHERLLKLSSMLHELRAGANALELTLRDGRKIAIHGKLVKGATVEDREKSSKGGVNTLIPLEPGEHLLEDGRKIIVAEGGVLVNVISK